MITERFNLISIGNRECVRSAYASGGACRCRQTKCDCSRHVVVDGSVSAGVGDITAEWGSMFEKVGIGLWVAFKGFNMGKDAA